MKWEGLYLAVGHLGMKQLYTEDFQPPWKFNNNLEGEYFFGDIVYFSRAPSYVKIKVIMQQTQSLPHRMYF